MPFVSVELVRHIVANAGASATIPTMNGRVQPLCGLYSRECLPDIERALSEGAYKLTDALERVNSTIISLTPALPFYASDLLDNLNERAEFERALRLQ
jgi:molybdopterin-guanine dinucleotide biosynthesis protein A